MIVDYAEKEGKIYLWIDTKRKKELDCVLQLVKYRPTLELFEQLQNKIYRMKKNKELQEITQKLKKEYYVSYVDEDPYHYWDEVIPGLYKVLWRKHRHDEVKMEVGNTLYHLAHENNVEVILQDGLKPTKYSKDHKHYGCNRVYLSTQPILSEHEKWIDGHLLNRIQLEIIFDGSYQLYVDTEYDHNEGSPMVYAITDAPIQIKGVSLIQPERRFKKNKQ